MTKSIITNCIMMLMLIIGVTSCSDGSDYGKILRHLPEDSDIVVVFNAEALISSSGGTVEKGTVKFSEEFRRLFVKDDIENYERTMKFLSTAGIDLTQMAIIYSYDHVVPTLVFNVEDINTFKPALEEYGFVETDSRDDITILSKRVFESPEGRNFDRFDYIALNEKCVYWKYNVCISQSAKPLRVLTDIIEGAHKSSFSNSPYAKYLKGNAGAMSFSLPTSLRDNLRKANLPTAEIEPLLSARICMSCNIDNDDLDLVAQSYDEKGKQLKVSDYVKYIDPDAAISTRPLAYLERNENLIYAFTLECIDWNEYFSRLNNTGMMTPSQKLAATIAKSYLEQIDGTVAVGMSLTDGFNSLTRINSGDNLLKELNITVVAETAKAKSVVEDLKSLMNTGNIEYTDNGDGFTFTVPESHTELTAKAVDNILILSNCQIDKVLNPVVKNFDFDDYNTTAILSLPHTDTLMKDLYIDNDVELSFSSDFDESKVVFNLSVSGDSNEGILAKLISMALSIESQEKSLNERYNGRCKLD